MGRIVTQFGQLCMGSFNFIRQLGLENKTISHGCSRFCSDLHDPLASSRLLP